jgi:DNA-binding transcriptional LysR family regulator
VRAIRVKGNLACSDGSVLHQWTLNGMGLAWRSLWEVQEDINAGRLITVLDEYAAPPNGIFALMPERKHIPQRLRLFVEMLKNHYASPAYWEAGKA